MRIWLSLLLIAALVGGLVPAVVLADTDTVTINATPSYVSITLNTSAFNFGTVAENVDEDTGTGYFGVDNVSTVVTSTTIVSNGWKDTNGVAPYSAWTWGAAGSDTGRMKASDGDGVYDVIVDATTPIALKTSQAATTDWVFELQIDAPSTMTHGEPQGTILTLSTTAG